MLNYPEVGSTFKNKRVLVAGGTGMVGQQLVRLLDKFGAKVRIASKDHYSLAYPGTEFMYQDLTVQSACFEVCKDMDYVFNLLCVKGSAALNKKYPKRFLVPMLRYNSFLTEAAYESGAGYLLTSTNGVYGLSEIMEEDKMWESVPSDNDKAPGYVKRMAELELESYAIEHGWKNIAIVRPANIYGPYDNFDSVNAMVVPSLIKKAVDNNGTMEVWGDGSQERDLIHSKDVARGMIMVAERMPGQAVNLGSGQTYSIRELVEVIVGNLENKPEIIWDTSKPSGDAKRFLDTQKARSMGFYREISLEKGIKETMAWYTKNRKNTDKRYDVFDKK